MTISSEGLSFMSYLKYGECLPQNRASQYRPGMLIQTALMVERNLSNHPCHFLHLFSRVFPVT